MEQRTAKQTCKENLD